MKKLELEPQQVFNFVGYQFDLVSGRVLPTQDRRIASLGKIKFHQEPEQLYSQTVHVPNRAAYSHREASFVGTSSYEANLMAFETSPACPRGFREDHAGSPVTPSTPRLVVG